MTIEQYGITLRRITFEDIEQIRQWRNQPEIRKRMAFKKYITKKMQEKWFSTINNKYNYYFIIHYDGKDIGVINCKNVNEKEAYGEGGIFISDPDYIGSMAPVFATLCLINAIFYVLKFSNKSFVQILQNNSVSIAYNKSIGYSLIPGQEKVKNQWYVLTKEDYELKAGKINKAAASLSRDHELPRVKGIPSDIHLDSVNELFK